MFQFGCCDVRIVDNCTKSNENYISSSPCVYEKGIEKLMNNFTVNRIEIFKLNF